MCAPPCGPSQGATRLLSHPHPGPGVTPLTGVGLSPVNPSVDAMTAYRCPPQDGESAMENVLSLIAKSCASVVRLGICAGWYPLMHR
jgi:hypothetical protein